MSCCEKVNSGGDTNAADEGYVSDEAPTHHNPETRTKISNELYDQKQAKEKQATANQAPKPKGEKEFEEEHKDTVQKVREREERGREWENANNNSSKVVGTRNDGGIKQCNQGKYQFWFEEESSKKGTATKTSDTLIMRVAIPKYLSTSLVDVDIHPTYVSIVIKSKILRVILPVEVRSDQSVARRSASSGYLELVMPKVNPDEIVIGLAHVRDHKEKGSMAGKQEVDAEAKINSKTVHKKRERLGHSMMEEAGKSNPLKIVQSQFLSDNTSLLNNVGDDGSDDEDEPPPLH